MVRHSRVPLAGIHIFNTCTNCVSVDTHLRGYDEQKDQRLKTALLTSPEHHALMTTPWLRQ